MLPAKLNQVFRLKTAVARHLIANAGPTAVARYVRGGLNAGHFGHTLLNKGGECLPLFLHRGLRAQLNNGQQVSIHLRNWS